MIDIESQLIIIDKHGNSYRYNAKDDPADLFIKKGSPL